MGNAECKPKCTGFWLEGFCLSDVAVVARNLRRSGDMIEVEVIEFLKGADEAEEQTRWTNDGRKYLTLRDEHKCRCTTGAMKPIAESDLSAGTEFMMNGFLSKGSLYAGEYQIRPLPHYQMMAARIATYPSMCMVFEMMVKKQMVEADLLRKSNIKLSGPVQESTDSGSN